MTCCEVITGVLQRDLLETQFIPCLVLSRGSHPIIYRALYLVDCRGSHPIIYRVLYLVEALIQSYTVYCTMQRLSSNHIPCTVPCRGSHPIIYHVLYHVEALSQSCSVNTTLLRLYQITCCVLYVVKALNQSCATYYTLQRHSANHIHFFILEG